MFKTKLILGLSRAIWDSDLIATRFTLALGEFAWAAMLLWIGDTFSRPTYTYMAYMMSEEVWGVVFLGSASTQLGIVLSGDVHTRFARYFACWNACLWGYTVVSMLLSVYPPPAAIGGEIALTFAAIWVWTRPYILAQGYAHAR
jgi:hypothetical protein